MIVLTVERTVALSPDMLARTTDLRRSLRAVKAISVVTFFSFPARLPYSNGCEKLEPPLDRHASSPRSILKVETSSGAGLYGMVFDSSPVRTQPGADRVSRLASVAA